MRVNVKVFLSQSSEPGPVRLFIGGLHGKEGVATKPVLEELLREGKPPSGRLILVPFLCLNGKHVSTLKTAYYQTREGRRALTLIQKYEPDIYVELHCYRVSAYAALTSPERRVRRGVPPLIELERGVLIGPVSPLILSKFDPDTGILLEIPCRGREAGKVALGVLRLIRDSTSSTEILGRLGVRYPDQIARASELFPNWFGRKA